MTSGEDSIGEPIRRCQSSRPLWRLNTQTCPSMPWTTRSSPTTAGEDASFPCGMSKRQPSVPFPIASSLTLPQALPMYATPPVTTAGYSSRPPSGLLQITRKGGRRWIDGCVCVLASFAP